jgi:hypothetical protein
VSTSETPTDRTPAAPSARGGWRTVTDTAAAVVLPASTGAARTPVPLEEARRVARLDAPARQGRPYGALRSALTDPRPFPSHLPTPVADRRRLSVVNPHALFGDRPAMPAPDRVEPCSSTSMPSRNRSASPVIGWSTQAVRQTGDQGCYALARLETDIAGLLRRIRFCSSLDSVGPSWRSVDGARRFPPGARRHRGGKNEP